MIQKTCTRFIVICVYEFYAKTIAVEPVDGSICRFASFIYGMLYVFTLYREFPVSFLTVKQ